MERCPAKNLRFQIWRQTSYKGKTGQQWCSVDVRNNVQLSLSVLLQLQIPEMLMNTTTTSLCVSCCTLGSKYSLGRLHTLWRSSTWWMANCDSSDQSIFPHWSIVKSRCFWTQCWHSWQWLLVNRGAWIEHLLRSPKPNRVRCAPKQFNLDLH